MDQATADRIARLIVPALNAALKAEGFEAKLINRLSKHNHVTCQLAVEVKGLGVDLDKVEFDRYAHVYGLTSADHNREVVGGRKKFRVVSLRPGSKYPVVGICATSGRRYDLDEKWLEQLKAKPAQANGKDKGAK